MSEPARIRNVAVVGHRGTGKDVTRRGAPLPDGEDQPPGHGRGRNDGVRRGRGRAQAAALDLDVARAHRVAGPEGELGRRTRRPCVPGRAPLRGTRRRGSARDGVRGHGRRGRHGARVEARGRARARASRLREHARPRARRCRPRPCSASRRCPAEPCIVRRGDGANDSRAEQESIAPKSKSVRVLVGLAAVEEGALDLPAAPLRPAVATPKVMWVESIQWCVIGASGFVIAERRCGNAPGPSAGSPAGPPYSCQLQRPPSAGRTAASSMNRSCGCCRSWIAVAVAHLASGEQVGKPQPLSVHGSGADHRRAAISRPAPGRRRAMPMIQLMLPNWSPPMGDRRSPASTGRTRWRAASASSRQRHDERRASASPTGARRSRRPRPAPSWTRPARVHETGQLACSHARVRQRGCRPAQHQHQRKPPNQYPSSCVRNGTSASITDRVVSTCDLTTTGHELFRFREPALE